MEEEIKELSANVNQEIQQISEADPRYEKYLDDPFVHKQFTSQIKTLEIVKNRSNNAEIFELNRKQKELDRLQDVYSGLVENMKADPVAIAK